MKKAKPEVPERDVVDGSARTLERESYRDRFATKLREAREKSGKSQDEISVEIGASPQTIINYENRRSLPDAQVLSRLATCLRVDLNSLLDPGVDHAAVATDPLEVALNLLTSAHEQGVVGFYQSRSAALREFAPHLQAERERICIVGSSIRGLMEGLPNFPEIIRKRNKQGVKIRVILSSPLFSFLREPIESRRKGAILDEIKEAAFLLTRHDGPFGLDDNSVRFFPGTPTVFLFATSTHMLLNPYTYGTMAYQTFSMLVQRRPGFANSIYEMYLREHFRKAYRNSIPFKEFDEISKSHKEWETWADEGRKHLEKMIERAETQSNSPADDELE